MEKFLFQLSNLSKPVFFLKTTQPNGAWKLQCAQLLKKRFYIFLQLHNNNGKTDTRSICFMFFKNSLIFVVDKIPHSQGTTSYLGISKLWNIQLLLFVFVINSVVVPS